MGLSVYSLYDPSKIVYDVMFLFIGQPPYWMQKLDANADANAKGRVVCVESQVCIQMTHT